MSEWRYGHDISISITVIWIFNKDIITSKLAIINMLDFEYWRSFYSSQYMYLVGFFFQIQEKNWMEI